MEKYSGIICQEAALSMSCHPSLTEMMQLICRIHEILLWARENLVLTDDRKSFRVDQDNYLVYQQAIEHLVRITDFYFTS